MIFPPRFSRLASCLVLGLVLFARSAATPALAGEQDDKSTRPVDARELAEKDAELRARDARLKSVLIEARLAEELKLTPHDFVATSDIVSALSARTPDELRPIKAIVNVVLGAESARSTSRNRAFARAYLRFIVAARGPLPPSAAPQEVLNALTQWPDAAKDSFAQTLDKATAYAKQEHLDALAAMTKAVSDGATAGPPGKREKAEAPRAPAQPAAAAKPPFEVRTIEKQPLIGTLRDKPNLLATHEIRGGISGLEIKEQYLTGFFRKVINTSLSWINSSSRSVHGTDGLIRRTIKVTQLPFSAEMQLEDKGLEEPTEPNQIGKVGVIELGLKLVVTDPASLGLKGPGTAGMIGKLWEQACGIAKFCMGLDPRERIIQIRGKATQKFYDQMSGGERVGIMTESWVDPPRLYFVLSGLARAAAETAGLPTEYDAGPVSDTVRKGIDTILPFADRQGVELYAGAVVEFQRKGLPVLSLREDAGPDTRPGAKPGQFWLEEAGFLPHVTMEQAREIAGNVSLAKTGGNDVADPSAFVDGRDVQISSRHEELEAALFNMPGIVREAIGSVTINLEKSESVRGGRREIDLSNQDAGAVNGRGQLRLYEVEYQGARGVMMVEVGRYSPGNATGKILKVAPTAFSQFLANFLAKEHSAAYSGIQATANQGADLYPGLREEIRKELGWDTP